MRGFGDYEIDGTCSTCKARDWKDVTDIVIERNVADTLQTTSGDWGRSDHLNYVIHGSQDPIVSDKAFPLGRNQGQENVVGGVRRLTPVEAERLQGFPDGHTDIGWKGKATPDSHRYKAMGNSMAVPVMRWIGQRIKEHEHE